MQLAVSSTLRVHYVEAVIRSNLCIYTIFYMSICYRWDISSLSVRSPILTYWHNRQGQTYRLIGNSMKSHYQEFKRPVPGNLESQPSKNISALCSQSMGKRSHAFSYKNGGQHFRSSAPATSSSSSREPPYIHLSNTFKTFNITK